MASNQKKMEISTNQAPVDMECTLPHCPSVADRCSRATCLSSIGVALTKQQEENFWHPLNTEPSVLVINLPEPGSNPPKSRAEWRIAIPGATSKAQRLSNEPGCSCVACALSRAQQQHRALLASSAATTSTVDSATVDEREPITESNLPIRLNNAPVASSKQATDKHRQVTESNLPIVPNNTPVASSKQQPEKKVTPRTQPQTSMSDDIVGFGSGSEDDGSEYSSDEDHENELNYEWPYQGLME